MIHPDVSAWLGALDAPSAAWRNALDAQYGALGMPPDSRAMLRATLLRFRERFGETPAQVRAGRGARDAAMMETCAHNDHPQEVHDGQE